MEEIFKDLPNVEVICFEGLTVEFVRQQKAAVMLRGVRTVSDIELEFTMTLTNRALEPGIETVSLMASDRFSHIPSTLIEQIASMSSHEAGTRLSELVPLDGMDPMCAKSRPSHG